MTAILAPKNVVTSSDADVSNGRWVWSDSMAAAVLFLHVEKFCRSGVPAAFTAPFRAGCCQRSTVYGSGAFTSPLG